MRMNIKQVEERIKHIRSKQHTLWNKLANHRDGIDTETHKKLSKEEYFSAIHRNIMDKTMDALKTCYKNMDDVLGEAERLVDSLHSEDELPFDITVSDPILDSIEFLVDSIDPNTREKDTVRLTKHDEFISKYIHHGEKYTMEQDERKRQTDERKRQTDERKRQEEERKRQEEERKRQEEAEHPLKQLEALNALVQKGNVTVRDYCHGNLMYDTYTWTDPNPEHAIPISQYNTIQPVHEWVYERNPLYPPRLHYRGRKNPFGGHNDNCYVPTHFKCDEPKLY